MGATSLDHVEKSNMMVMAGYKMVFVFPCSLHVGTSALSANQVPPLLPLLFPF